MYPRAIACALFMAACVLYRQSNCHREYLDHNASTIYSLALYRKKNHAFLCVIRIQNWMKRNVSAQAVTTDQTTCWLYDFIIFIGPGVLSHWGVHCPGTKESQRGQANSRRLFRLEGVFRYYEFRWNWSGSRVLDNIRRRKPMTQRQEIELKAGIICWGRKGETAWESRQNSKIKISQC